MTDKTKDTISGCDDSSRSFSSHDSEDLDLSSTTQTYEQVEEEAIEIAATETRWIQWSKFLVALVLICGTTLTAYAAYNFTSTQQENDFNNQFESIGNVIVDASQITADNVFDTIKSMSTTITSFAKATNATWPFVTIPDYGARGSQLLKLSGSFYLALSPIVPPHLRAEWEEYSVENLEWLHEDQASNPTSRNGNGRDLQERNVTITNSTDTEDSVISPHIWEGRGRAGDNLRPIAERDSPYAPFWQVTPPTPRVVNWDLFSSRNFDAIYEAVLQTEDTVLSDMWAQGELSMDNERTWPISYLTSPIFEGGNLVALYNAVIPWHKYFVNTVPAGMGGLHVVVRNSCNQSFTYLADGETVTFEGFEDVHDPRFSHMEIYDRFDVTSDQVTNKADSGTCKYGLSVYPTEKFHATFVTNEPYYYTAAVVLIFALTSLVFILYDCLVKRKDKKVMTSATNSNAIVDNLFPAAFRDRLINDVVRRKEEKSSAIGGLRDEEDQKVLLLKTKPIADLFPNCTLLFADIAGFTSWASTREPSHVFTLLEQVYGSFDILAKSRGVFKVETTGDCYVAAAGLPEARADHAVAMIRFARDCLNEMNQTVRKLEVLLGPDTSDLSMRFGIHSGPVTGGVLRGDKSRFQLFGDTVNMASRVESTGMPNRIHVSQETANCLIEQGRGAWLKARKDLVFAKGKGDVQTYWVDFGRALSHRSGQNSSVIRASNPKNDFGRQNMKVQRLIDWNVTVLEGLLKKIVAMRPANDDTKSRIRKKEPQLPNTTAATSVLDEVKEIIELPGKAASYKQDPESVELDPVVIAELRGYVSAISSMYRENDFHNFDHASHVTMSVVKLLGRVVTPDTIDYNELSYKQNQKASQLHEYTYGITSDPLTQFACAFSAMIHDVDHVGIPNAALIKEDAEIAARYKNKSVAEQNSVDLAWSILESDNFVHLRKTIYSNKAELRRFRQLVVNSVMATDIADKELGALRKNRWNKAFNLDDSARISVTNAEEDINRKATIVIEHLIQASDVSHTMQHWHVYLKWNERLFREMYKAYLAGRIDNDPSIGWYKGELGFFDFYLIPLGKKLKECGVFGVSSDEYLNYALANRKEWELKGKEVVARYLDSFHKSESMTLDK